MLLSLLGPLIYSFVKPLHFFKRWGTVFTASLAMMVFFIPWDIVFTEMGVWWFDHQYTMGLDIASLPVEEWLFFLIVPFACVFVYEVLNHYLPFQFGMKWVRLFYLAFFALSLVLALVYSHQKYTFIAGLLAALLALVMAWRMPDWAGNFMRMYAVVWLPFIIVNGILTGSLTEGAAIVNYNPEEFIGLRIITIPVEDGIYNFSMLLSVVGFYHLFLNHTDKKQLEN